LRFRAAAVAAPEPGAAEDVAAEAAPPPGRNLKRSRWQGANNKCAFCASLLTFMRAASGQYLVAHELREGRRHGR